MKVNSFAKVAAGIGTFAVLAAGLVMASPAHADPAGGPSDAALVGVGSDTTQDVMDAIAADINTAAGSTKLASYTSTIPAGGANTIQTRATNASNPSNGSAPTNVLRAKGSGDGWKILQVAEGSSSSISTVATMTSSNQTANKANAVGQIDYSRASSLQGNASATGEYVDIPFAIDAVDVAVNPNSAVSKIPLTLGSMSDDETKPTLRSIYQCKATYVYTDASNNYVAVGNQADPANLPDNATYTAGVKAAIAHTDAIVPLLPGYGSGTAAYFIKQVVNVTDAGAFPAAGSGFECIKRVKSDNTTSIQEHDGSAIADRTNSLGVYSIGQWAAQMNHATTGVTDRTNGTVLMDLADSDPALRVPATTGSVGAGTLAPNAANWSSSLKRNVYNIVSYRKAADPTSKVHEMFTGTSSLVCQQTAAITRMGFALMPGAADGGDPTANPNACGNITFRRTTGAVNTGTFLNMTVDASVTSTVASEQLQNVPFTVSVNGGTATHDMGGRVVILDTQYDGTVDQSSHVWGSATIAAGASVATNVTVTVPATGSKKLYAYFIPNMGAFKVTTMSPVNAGTDDSFATVNVAIPDSTTKVTVRKASLGGTTRVIAWIDSLGALPGGTVTLYKDSVAPANKLADETITAEENAAVLSFVQDAASKVLVADFVPADGSVNPSHKDFTVTVAKATPTVSEIKVASGNNALTAGANPIWANTKKSAQAVAGVTATATVATDLFTKNAHGLTNGNFVVFTPNAGKTLPEGIIQGVGYYVIADGLTTNSFKVSATLNGSAVDLTTAGTGFKYGLYKSPVVTATVTGVGTGAGAVRPTGSVKYYIGSTASDYSNEVTAATAGTVLSNATAANASVVTSKLPQVINWGTPVAGTIPTAGKDVFLIVKYAGDANYNEAVLAKKVKVKP